MSVSTKRINLSAPWIEERDEELVLEVLRSVDDHEIGVGPVTQQIQKAYLDTVRGQSERWGQWLDHVPQLARS